MSGILRLHGWKWLCFDLLVTTYYFQKLSYAPLEVHCCAENTRFWSQTAWSQRGNFLLRVKVNNISTNIFFFFVIAIIHVFHFVSLRFVSFRFFCFFQLFICFVSLFFFRGLHYYIVAFFWPLYKAVGSGVAELGGIIEHGPADRKEKHKALRGETIAHCCCCCYGWCRWCYRKARRRPPSPTPIDALGAPVSRILHEF